MLKNNLKIALRYLANHKSYAAINIIGLTLGFLCFLLLMAYVSSENNFDTQHGHVFRLLRSQPNAQGDQQVFAQLGPQVGYTAKEQFPEIEAAAEIVVLGRMTVGNEPASRGYERITVVDEGFFDVFDFKFLDGNAQSVFSQPNALLLTRSVKEKYFGKASALGKTLRLNEVDGVVAGVVEDFPPNTHFTANLMLAPQTAAVVFDWWKEFVATNWHRNAFWTYFKLREDADLASLENKITRLAGENWPKEEDFNSVFTLQPVTDIHLSTLEVDGEVNHAKGNLFYINLFFWIAIMILLVACFNYTGLLNVAFMGRSREIGLRKVLGAGRRELLRQFLLESLLLTSVSMLAAWGILQLIQPYLPGWFGPAFNLSALPLQQILWIALAGLAISLLSIGYPVYLISRTVIVRALKEERKGRAKVPFRKVMTVFQFVTAIVLIACTSILYRQVNYLQQKELGFDANGLLVVDINSGTLRSKFKAIKQSFSELPEVQSVSVSSRVPGEWKLFPSVEVTRQGQAPGQFEEMIFIGADEDFLSTFEVSLLQGNNFSGSPSDSSKVIVNKSAVEALALEEPIGQWIDIPAVLWPGEREAAEQPIRVQIVGVAEDFHFEDIRNAIQPMVIGFWDNPIHRIDYYTLRVNTTDWGNTIAALRRINDGFDPENPLEYNILNDQFERFYEGDILRSRLLLFFAGVVIFIACLGLLAMTAFTLKNRIKEIGIRKVLGANTTQIVGLVTSGFLKLVVVGAVIAIPIAWLLMNRWLKEFAYRIPLEWWMFVLAGLVVLVIAFVTISTQSIRAALTNPVESLRSE